MKTKLLIVTLLKRLIKSMYLDTIPLHQEVCVQWVLEFFHQHRKDLPLANIHTYKLQNKRQTTISFTLQFPLIKANKK
jgi:hypothetical protein